MADKTLTIPDPSKSTHTQMVNAVIHHDDKGKRKVALNYRHPLEVNACDYDQASEEALEAGGKQTKFTKAEQQRLEKATDDFLKVLAEVFGPKMGF